MSKKWDDFKKELNITEEQQQEIRFENELIEATIEGRKKVNLIQRELPQKSEVIQASITKIEKMQRSPQVDTLIRLLHPMGYTLKIVPVKKRKRKEMYKLIKYHNNCRKMSLNLCFYKQRYISLCLNIKNLLEMILEGCFY